LMASLIVFEGLDRKVTENIAYNRA